MQTIKGIAVFPGIIIARAFVLEQFRERIPYHRVAGGEVARELNTLEEAISAARGSLHADRDRVEADLGAEPAKIFEFHLGLLNDPALMNPVRARIEEESVTAAFSVSDAFSTLADRFRNMGSDVFRDKARDILDLERRLIDQLLGQSEDRMATLTEPVAIVGHEMTPRQAASLTEDMVVGLATDFGGRTDHTSIVAAALGMPVVVGCQTLTEHVDDGDLLIIDGVAGEVIIDPDPETVSIYEERIARLSVARSAVTAARDDEAITIDGTKISLMGNIEFPHEITSLIEQGGEGVGLYRTEFLYLTSSSEPTEEELYDQYSHCLRLLEGRPLTIRTLDLGADKYTQAQAKEPERNPFLGLRSIRYSLQHLPQFRCQLRAILRASAHGPMRVMFPLITTMNELKQAKMILGDVREELEEEGISVAEEVQVGMMVEVPSAALMASTFAKEVDFFSIGTNDLIQYTVAVDRGNQRVANLYSAANPAVLRLVKDVIRSGKRRNIDTSLCGEIAGDITYTMLLIGLGLRTLSLVPAQIPRIKQVIRRVDVKSCERLARKVGSFDSERRTLKCLQDELKLIMPELDGGWTTG
jgi:phosphotransferase system enzyme I (PtsI)